MVKHIFCLTFAVIIGVACNKPYIESFPSTSKSCEQILEETDPLLLLAQQLAYHDIANGVDTAYQNEVLLPPQKQQKIYTDLLAIKKLANAEADTVFNLCQIPLYYDDTLMRHLTVKVKQSPCTSTTFSIWTGVSKKCPLGDEIIFKYNIQTYNYTKEFEPGSTTDFFYTVNLVACKPLNMVGLLKKLKADSLVKSAINHPSYKKPPLVVSMQKTQTHTDYQFGYGWGTCQQGCAYWRYWTFRVDKNNKAIFLHSQGDNSPQF
jgi:hypothetical protein